MFLLVTGNQDFDYIYECLTDFHKEFELTGLCGLLSSPCMDAVVEWAEDHDVFLDLYLPSGDTDDDTILMHSSIINESEPDAVLVLDENNKKVVKRLVEDSYASNSVQYIINRNDESCHGQKLHEQP